LLYQAMKAAEDLDAEGISTAVVNARFVKPLDSALLEGLAARFKYIVTLEENTVVGGFGSAVLEFFASKGLHPHVAVHGIKDEFIEHGAPAELQKALGLDRAGILAVTRKLVGARQSSSVAV
jgi:1-deoxy-D-xylulose-5-phosphate synthase